MSDDGAALTGREEARQDVLRDLINHLATAVGPDSKLDWGIAQRLGWTTYWSAYTFYLPPGEVEGSELATIDGPPRYTSSLDAALTLVPTGLMYAIAGPWVYSELVDDKSLIGKPTWDAAVTDDLYGIDVECLTDLDNHGKGATPAIALCIAALKARSPAPQGAPHTPKP